MLRSLLVVIHAGSGIGGLVTGLASLSPPRPGDGREWWRRLYLVCIATLVASMVALVAIDWAGLDIGARVAFGALTVLGAVMAYRLARARGEAMAQRPGWDGRYVDHIAFTYISLWEGFVILPALNLPLPQVSVPVVAIAVLLVAHALIGRHKDRVTGVSRGTKRSARAFDRDGATARPDTGAAPQREGRSR